MIALRRARLGNVEFSVVSSENITKDADVTEKPVEQGQDIADHIKPRPLTIALTGIITGSGAHGSLQQLYKYQKSGELLSYVGRSSNASMVIERLTTDHGADVAGGFRFNMVIKQVKVAVGKQMEVAINSKVAQQVKKDTNKGKQQLQSKSVSNDIVLEVGRSTGSYISKY